MTISTKLCCVEILTVALDFANTQPYFNQYLMFDDFSNLLFLVIGQVTLQSMSLLKNVLLFGSLLALPQEQIAATIKGRCYGIYRDKLFSDSQYIHWCIQNRFCSTWVKGFRLPAQYLFSNANWLLFNVSIVPARHLAIISLTFAVPLKRFSVSADVLVTWCLKLFTVLLKCSTTVLFVWVPSHDGSFGNETADWASKASF